MDLAGLLAAGDFGLNESFHLFDIGRISERAVVTLGGQHFFDRFDLQIDPFKDALMMGGDFLRPRLAQNVAIRHRHLELCNGLARNVGDANVQFLKAD